MLYIWQGHRFGYDRSTCDKMFLNHMLATCTGRKRLVNCQHSAEIFWSAVRVGAYFHYHETAPAYCSEPWISQCLAWKITCIQNSFSVYILLTLITIIYIFIINFGWFFFFQTVRMVCKKHKLEPQHIQ